MLVRTLDLGKGGIKTGDQEKISEEGLEPTRDISHK